MNRRKNGIFCVKNRLNSTQNHQNPQKLEKAEMKEKPTKFASQRKLKISENAGFHH